MRLELPDGTKVQATALGRPEADPEPDWGLCLDERWDPPWPHHMVYRPDLGLPSDVLGCDRATVAALRPARSGERVEVGCHGGLGRTGTVLACMAVLAGVAPGRRWAVRPRYRPQAVETHSQIGSVLEFARRRRRDG